MKPNHAGKLSSADWFRAGLDGLVTGGPESLKAAKLARVLGVTTGSFYWHFECVAEFRSGLLEYWEKSVIGGLMYAATASAEEPSQVLDELGKHIRKSGAHAYDTAMRDWARNDLLVRDTVNRADGARATFLAEALRTTGISEEEARDRANLIGAAWRGSKDLPDLDYRVKLMGIAASD